MTQKKRKRKGSRKFCQTKVGYLLQHTVPIEYDLLMGAAKAIGQPAPTADMIEAISYISNEPVFSQTRFRLALIEYRQYGLRPPRAITTNVDKELYYIRLRLKKYSK